jgi:hypothetical protein
LHQIEFDRRLTDRVLLRWTAITGDKRLPRYAEITPAVFGDDWRSCALIKLAPELTASQLLHLGDEVPIPEGTTGSKVLGDFAEDSLVRQAADIIPAVIAMPAPITDGGAREAGANLILYRSVVLPISEDNRVVDHVLLAISYRDVALSEAVSEKPQSFDRRRLLNPRQVSNGRRPFRLL